jgi:adenine-specific DNA-methyltransferase
MARIEDLIKDIADPRLRDQIANEVAKLKSKKRFGLVFEEHLPEIVQMPRLAVKPGARVAKRADLAAGLFLVDALANGKKVSIIPERGGPAEVTGKDDIVVVKRFGDPMYPALLPVQNGNVTRAPGKPYHTLINADNFHALQVLLYCYEGQVDAIYIDPPYNSGARDWKYNNDYVDRSDQYRHSKWLSMIQRRLELAKRLLKPDGVLIITIDENEVGHLSVLLEAIFPGHLRHMVAAVINPKGTGKLNFARVDEYLFFCVPNDGTSLIKGIPTSAGITGAPGEGALFYPSAAPQAGAPEGEEDGDAEDEDTAEGVEDEAPDVDSIADEDLPFPSEEIEEWELRHARRRGSESSYRHQRWHQFYPIYINVKTERVVRTGPPIPLDEKPNFTKVGGLLPVWPIDKEGNDRCWRFISATMQKLIEERRVRLGKFNATHNSWTLNIWERKPESKKLKTIWWKRAHDAGTHGTTLLHRILGRRATFPFPKSIYAVADSLAAVVRTRPNALIVDFFAGSGTTLHATCMLNAVYGGNRRCVLVTNNEVDAKLAAKLQKDGIQPGSAEYEEHGICTSVTWPRVEAVLTGKRRDKSKLPGKYLDGREMSLGFPENAQYLTLDFLDPAEVRRGDSYEAILTILWMMAGASGDLELSKGSGKYHFPKGCPFCVLLREDHFQEFSVKLSERPDITLVFLVTDSVEAFHEMASHVSKGRRCVQLYKSYLDNFKINLEPKHAD